MSGTSAEPSRAIGTTSLVRTCGHLIRRSEQVHTQLWIEQFGTELTSPQYGVLAALAARPGIDQRALGELASLDKSSTADIVRRLERKLWVTRERDPRDARRNILTLAPAAAIAFEHLTPRARAVQVGLLRPLEAVEREAFVERLARVARIDEDVAHEQGAAVLEMGAPGHLVRRSQQVHTAIWAEEFAGELTGPQYAVLQVGLQWPGANQRQLGERAALDKSTAADIVDRLERRGWLGRDVDPADARGRVIELTAEGERVARDYAPRVARVQHALLAPLAERDRQSFLTALTAVAFAGAVPWLDV